MKEKLLDRLTKLEGQVCLTNTQFSDLVTECYASLFMTILQQQHGCSKDKAREETIREGNGFFSCSWPMD